MPSGLADGAALKSLQEALHKAKQSAHIAPVGERLDACQERAKKRLAKADADLLRLQTERAQLATELAEGQARFEALRTEAGAVPTVQSAPKDLSSELQRMQGGDRRASAGTIRVDGHTPRGSQDSHGFSGDGGFTVDTHGSVDRRSRNQTTTCGGWVEFSMSVRSRRCSARYGLRGVRVGEASHPGPSFIRLRRATSLVNVASTHVDSGRFSALDEDQFAAAPTLLDSLTGIFLSMAPPHSNLGDDGRVGVRSPRGADADDCSSVSSESCWGEMEDIRDYEVVEWGVLPHPPQAGPDSVVNALHFDLTRGESDTESVRTVLEEGYPEDLQKRMM